MTSLSLLQGIIGDTYERFTVGQEAFNPNSTFWLPEDVSSYITCSVDRQQQALTYDAVKPHSDTPCMYS